MKISDLKNKCVKCSKRSITVKDDSNKTIGVLSGIEKVLDLQCNKLFEYSGILRKSGIWTAELASNVYVKNGKLFFLYNIKSEKETSIANDVAQYMEIIPVYFLT